MLPVLRQACVPPGAPPELDCLPLWVASLVAFRAMLLELLTLSWQLSNVSLFSATMGVWSLGVRLVAEGSFLSGPPALCVSMSSSLCWTGDGAPPINLTRLSTVYLRSLRSSLRSGEPLHHLSQPPAGGLQGSGDMS